MIHQNTWYHFWKKFIIAALFIFFPTHTLYAQNHSSIVYPGNDGKLVYVPDDYGNIIPDFSHAGYAGGGVKLPEAPVKITLIPVPGDDAIQIQRAIERLSMMPLDENGIRGALLLKKGTYDLYSPITVYAGGVVIRGEGQGPDGTVLTGYGKHDLENGCYLMNISHMIIIRGSGGLEEVSGTASRITDDYVPVGAYSFSVETVSGFHIGDTVIVRRHGNEEWLKAIGMSAPKPDGWVSWRPTKHDFDRVITKIEGNTITVYAPITCPIESRWGGGEVIKSRDPERIRNVGIENLRGVSKFDPTVTTATFQQTEKDPGREYFSDENHYWNFIWIDNAVNAWARDITAVHFARSCVHLGNNVKWATVQDCTGIEHVSYLSGCRRSPFCINGQLCMIQRCSADNGRHDFVMDGSFQCGPNVYLDCSATNSFSSSEPHKHWATGALYDNVSCPLTLRFWERITHGWEAAWCVFWNCEGMFLVQKPPQAQNYAIGHVGEQTMIHNVDFIDFSLETGFIESRGLHVDPRSLYLTQMSERLGTESVRNIGKE
ncbi:hypothetical protein ES708_18868 [subsurface metagenome]